MKFKGFVMSDWAAAHSTAFKAGLETWHWHDQKVGGAGVKVL